VDSPGSEIVALVTRGRQKRMKQMPAVGHNALKQSVHCSLAENLVSISLALL